jgi:hypothetical protein
MLSYSVINGEIWGVAEVGVNIIASCGPVRTPVLEKMLPETLLH